MALRRDVHWPSLAILATGLVSVCPIEVLAQTSTVSCGSSFDWMNNSKNQNPCVVAAYLQGACNNGQFTVNPLPLGSYYIGPTAGEQNECQCSTVTYNTICACSACQSRGFTSWASWAYNCTVLSLGVFLPDIPDDTAVPQWAFQNVTKSDGPFNVTLAQSVGDNPESTATHVQSTASVVATSTVSASITSSPSTSSTSSPVSSSKSSNTGVVAGGVVGGVVGVALIAGVVIFLKKKPSQILPSAPAYPPPDYTDTTSLFPEMAQPKLYDPSDPTTFPTPAPPIILTTESSSGVHNPTINYPSRPVHPGGQYSGVPEI